jgi:hypothetical protein
MADAAAHIEHLASRVEPPALRHQPQEIEIPPVVSRITEILRGVRRQPLELVAHGRFLQRALVHGQPEGLPEIFHGDIEHR